MSRPDAALYKKQNVSTSSISDNTQKSSLSAEADLSSVIYDLHKIAGHQNTAASLAPVKRKDVLAWLCVSDALSLVVGFICSWALTDAADMAYFHRSLPNLWLDDSFRLERLVGIGATVLVWFAHTAHYRVRMPFWQESHKIVRVMAAAMLLDGFMEFTSKEDSSRLWLVSGWAVAGIVLMWGRAAMRTFLRNVGLWQMPTLLVGDGAEADEVRSLLTKEPSLGYEICAQIHDLAGGMPADAPSWRKLCDKHGASYVIIALDCKNILASNVLLNQLQYEDVPFSILPPVGQYPIWGLFVQPFFSHDTALLTRSSRLEQALPRIMKRLMDIVLSSVALFVFSPVLVTIAALVKMDGGPALFGHKRLGMNGKTFPCLKFRSMVPNAEEALKCHLAANANAREEWVRDQKLRNDPRVTKLGEFLRRTSLDELPQLINVLRGDMSLVGPRPIVSAEVVRYANAIAHYFRVRPGITGLWQVSGRNDVSYKRRVRLDCWYVCHWSLWHDIAIMCKTIPVLLNRKGAY